MRSDVGWSILCFAGILACGSSEPDASTSTGTNATSTGIGASTTGTTTSAGSSVDTGPSTGASVVTSSSSAGGSTGAGGSLPTGGTGGSDERDGSSMGDAASDGGAPLGDASAVHPPTGPFTCTQLVGLFSTGEWWDAGFYDGLGAELKPKWQGRFTHYGYTYEYAKPDSYAWSPVNVGGTNNVRLTAPCAQNGSAPDRIVYQAWTWELTTEDAWVASLEAALATIRAKLPSAKRIDLMTIIRCPMNLWCRAEKPPLGPNTDHDATKQDCHVPEYVDSAFAKVAAAHPDLVSVVRPFEAHACAMMIDGIHLHEQTGPVAADIAAYYKMMP
jgi:hypothetical protein